MKKPLLLTVILICFIQMFAQSQQIFQKTFGSTGEDEATAVAQTSDSGYIMVGNTYSFGFTISHIYVVKFDKSGNMLWNKTFGGSTYPHYATSVVATKDGGCAIAGGGYEINKGPQVTSMLLLKLSAAGTLQWARYCRADSRTTLANTVLQSLDGGYIMGGYSSGEQTDDLYFNRFFLKTDSLGNLKWARTFFDAVSGWNYIAAINKLIQIKDSSYVMVSQNIDQYTGKLNIYLSKMDKLGHTEWAKQVKNNSSNEYPADLKRTSDGSFIIAGNTQMPDYSWEMFAIKTDSSGNFLWGKNIGTGSSKSQVANSVIIAKDSGYVFAGTTDSSFNDKPSPYLVKLDKNGNLLWTKVINTNFGISLTSVSKIIKSNDNKYVLSCTMNTETNGEDFSLIKIDTSGNICGDFTEEGQSQNNGQIITITDEALDESPYYYISPDILTAENGGLNTICSELLPVTLLSFTGFQQNGINKLSWVTAQEINSSYFDVERSSNGKNFYVIDSINAAGNSNIKSNYGFTDYKPGTINYYRIKMVDKDGRFSYSYILNINNTTAKFSVYPNPVKDRLTLAISSNSTSIIQIQIVSMDGRIIQKVSMPVSNGLNEQVLNVSALSQGMYVVKINTDNSGAEIKFVKN